MDADKAFKRICGRDEDFPFMEEEETAKLAAMVLNECNFNNHAARAFFDKLNDELHGELVSRAANEEDRD